jgi:hypothetical protein
VDAIAGIPLGALGIGSGWALVCVGVIMIFRGDLRTAREARATERQIEALTQANAVANETIREFKDVVATNNKLITDFLAVAKERSP